MAVPRVFDIVVAGGGIAGSCFAGIMARAGFGVLLVEREARYRDRVRGEATWPWGVAEARRCGLMDVYERAGSIEIVGVGQYEDRQRVSDYRWAEDSIDQLPEIGFGHTRMQEAAFAWATEHGATPLRPAKVERIQFEPKPRVTIQHDGAEIDVRTRLVVGADGKHSGLRRYTGGETHTDVETSRFGGVLLTGVEWETYTDDFESYPGWTVNWFPISTQHTRLYLRMPAEQLLASGVTHSFDTLIELASTGTPERWLEGATQAGPIAFFPNADVWTTRVAGDAITLIGDAAGSVDPCQGHGTSLLMRDIRELSEALLAEADWQQAIDGYAERRNAYYDVLHAYDLWGTSISHTTGPEGERFRARYERAKAADPALGGWNLIEARGPDGLVPDEAARRHYFGEDL